jgi:hypothetical protein
VEIKNFWIASPQAARNEDVLYMSLRVACGEAIHARGRCVQCSSIAVNLSAFQFWHFFCPNEDEKQL